MPPILYLFTLTNLVIGTGAFVLSGILKPMSDALGVSVAAAGQAMTAYAIASAFIAPLLIVATGRWPRKRAIQLALLFFTLGNLVCALAPNFLTLLAGRVLMGIGSMYSALAAGLVVAMVAPQLRARALAISFLGIGLSYAVGLPLGTWLGFNYGWHTPIWLVAVCSAIALIALSTILPAQSGAPGASFAGLAEQAKRGPVLRVWLRSLLYFIAIFSVFSYVGPVMQALNPLSPTMLSWTLAIFGLSGVVGTVLGGWAADRFGAVRTIRIQMLVLVTMMVLVPLTRANYPLTVLAFVVWGIAGFGMMAPQQARLASLAPAQAPLLLSLNGSMLYVGTALGAAISGGFVSTLGFDKLSWIGLPFGLAALLTLWWDRPARATPA
jgi:DHA1 family inner membrane transport protein